MRQVLFVILIFRLVLVYSQDQKPGGVQGSIIWNITETKSPGEAYWKSNIANDTSLLAVGGKKAVINNHPAMVFSNQISKKAITLNLGNLKSFSLFTVCQERDSLTEQVIFSLKNDSLTQLVLSNNRMAALDQYRYYNYNSNRNLYPKIYSYSQNQSDTSASHSNKLLFGRSPQRENLPVSAYNGIVPEIILFNRYLSPKERRRVESYLALKYGISLQQDFPASYLNSRGEVIWDAQVNADYNHHIAGIGRDDLSGLLQYTSESSESPGILHISTSDSLNNNSFLIWGDNNGSLRFEDKPGVRKFQREWRVTNFKSNDKSYTFRSNELAFSQINPLKDGETFWLMIDKSGTGKFPFGETEYIKSRNTASSDKSILFSPVKIDSDSSGSDAFTFLAAPAFFTRSTVISPSCSDINSGTIQTDIVGGESPYKMVLMNGTTNETKTLTETDNSHIFSNISQGGYSLYVTDANNQVFSEEIWVSNRHAWKSSVLSDYRLDAGEKLSLNASDGMPAGNFQYTWTTPDEQTLHSDDITISRKGNYALSITDENGCSSLQKITVLTGDKPMFKNTELFPNPVKGWFVLRIELETIADVQISIYNMNSRLITRDNLYNQQYYRYTNIIQSPGVYTITLESENELKSFKLIVE